MTISMIVTFCGFRVAPTFSFWNKEFLDFTSLDLMVYMNGLDNKTKQNKNSMPCMK